MYVQRNEEGRVVGVYANLQEGYAEEYVPDDHPEVVAFLSPPTVPIEVTRFQALAALQTSGLLETVENFMADPNTPALAKLAYKEAQSFRRDSPTVEGIGAQLNLSKEQLDQLFILAATIYA